MSVNAIAKIPVNTPGPKALRKIRDQTSISMPLRKSKHRRKKKRSPALPNTFRAVKKASGKATIEAIKVPKTAIITVSSKANQTTPCCHSSLSFISVKTKFRLDFSAIILSPENTNPSACQILKSRRGLLKSKKKNFQP